MAHSVLGSAEDDVVFGHDLDGAIVGDVHDPGGHGLAVGEVDEDLIAGTPSGFRLVHRPSMGPPAPPVERTSRTDGVSRQRNRREMRPAGRLLRSGSATGQPRTVEQVCHQVTSVIAPARGRGLVV